MMRLCWTAFFLFAFGSAGSAQQMVSKYDNDTIDSSIKCDLARVSKAYGPQKVGGPVMKAVVTVKSTDTTTKKVGGNLFVGASYETVDIRTGGFKATRNINVDNHINCKKSFIVDLGLYSCFRGSENRFFRGETINCGGGSSGSLDLGAGGKWFLGIQLQADLIKKREWTVDVSAPPGK